MKEITRIHIAKQAYDIEIGAKKELEKYMKRLEQYAGDEDILEDIEIRITELLSENSVKPGDVIAEKDVSNLRKTLGEPEDFASDERRVIDDSEAKATKRLYRDPNGAMLGGVLNGFASFFGIDAVWVRLIFIILLFASFGTASLVYAILWIIIPPARTATERLQLAGKPVTLEALREESTEPDIDSSKVGKSILLIAAGVICSLVAIGALTLTCVAAASVLGGAANSFLVPNKLVSSSHNWIFWTAFSLFVLSGILMTILAAIAAIAAFTQKISKRIIVSMITITVAGVVAFSTGVGAMFYYSQVIREDIAANTRIQNMELPDGFSNIKKLTVEAAGNLGSQYGLASVNYVVTNDKPRLDFKSQVGDMPKVKVNGEKAEIDISLTATPSEFFGLAKPEITIYGPAIESLDVLKSTVIYSGPSRGYQDSLRIYTGPVANVQLRGSYAAVEVSGLGEVSAKQATIDSLIVNDKVSIDAGVVKSLTVNQSGACPTGGSSDRSIVNISGVSSGEMVYNGNKVPAENRVELCSKVIMDTGEDYED